MSTFSLECSKKQTHPLSSQNDDILMRTIHKYLEIPEDATFLHNVHSLMKAYVEVTSTLLIPHMQQVCTAYKPSQDSLKIYIKQANS